MLQNNISYQSNHILNNIEAIKKTIKANLGISILPKIAVLEDLKEETLIKLDIKEVKFERNFNIIHHKDKYKSKLFKQFINHLKISNN